MSDNITVICPECQTRYSLKPDMAGKRMQCRDASCGIVFEVTPLQTMAAAPTPTPRPVPAAESALDWRNAPPPIREESAPNWTEPPPVRTNGESALPAYLRPKPTNSRAKHWILALAAFVIVMASWGVISVIRTLAQAEERLAADADKAYADGKFGDAAQKYRTLIEKYARGLRAGEYKFLAALSDTRRYATIAPPEPDAAVSALTNFMNEYGASAYFAGRRGDVFTTTTKVLSDVIADGQDVLQSVKPELAAVDNRLQQAKQMSALAQRIAPPDADVASIQSKHDEFAKALESVRGTLAARAHIVKLLDQPRPDLEAARTAIRRANLGADADILAAWRKAEEVLRKSITYRTLGTPAADTKPVESIGRIIPDTRGPAGNGPRVPAMADGLLYALESRSGRLAWVDRVGIDANQLPIRLTTDTDDNLWLTYSTEPLGLSARKSSTGSIVWFQPLESPIIGSPIVAGRRIVVALAGVQGRVLDIDGATGQLTGMFETGQPLGGGVAWNTVSNRIYVPAIGHQVFVLDFGGDDVGLPPQCVATLNTEHPQGSLVGQPFVIPGPDGQPTLMLTVADGVGDAALWLIRLTDINANTLAMDRVSMSGWSWFPPIADPERLAWVTDRGLLHLMGLRRPGALDPPIFPLLDNHVVVNPPTGSMQRGMIAYADEAGLVVLSDGRLRQWQLGIDRQAGRQCKPGWALPDPIGVPLANAWFDDSGAIIITSRRSDLPMTLVTAVRPENGAIIWQRHLGLSPDVVAKPMGTNLVLVNSRGGATALPLLDELPKIGGWHVGGKEQARPLPSILREPWIDTSGDGITIVAATPTGLVIRKIHSDLTVKDTKAELPAPIAGRPGFGPDALILPLKSGQLYRLSLSEPNARPVPGPTWRAAGVGTDGEGGVTHWQGSEYLVLDGSRRLMRLSWSGATDYELGTATAVERPRRLLPPPTILPGTPPRAVVADAGGTAVMMRGPQMEVERFWRLGDDQRAITHGPELIGNRLAVIVNHRELICLDPTNNKPVWTYQTLAEGFVALPVPLGNGWLVADRNGSIALLDSQTGQPVRPGLQLPGLVAAAGPMVPVGPDRVFVVLTDGSAQIISAEQLTK